MDINFNIDKVRGYEKATEFFFSVSPTPLSAVLSVNYIFDDGKWFTGFSASHRYQHEGVYNPIVFVYTNTGIVSATKTIQINPYIDESIRFDFVPPPAFAGHYNRYPFKINITSKTTEDHFIDLSTMFSRSYKHQEIESKWGFLRPEWRFLDLAGNIIDSIKTTDTILKIDDYGNQVSDGTVVGVSGSAEFYFIDDIYNFDLSIAKDQFTTLIATLRSDKVPTKDDYVKTGLSVYGYSNSNSVAIFPYNIQPRPPEKLKITENGISYHVNPKWVDVHTPVIVNSIPSKDFTDEWIDGNGASQLYRPLEYFIKDIPIIDIKIPIIVQVSNINTVFTPSDTSLNLYDATRYKIPGYYKGQFDTNSLSGTNCFITASADIPIPTLSSLYVYPILWVSNPESKTLHTAQYFYQANLSAVSGLNMNKAQTFAFDIPVVESSDYTNLSMAVTGFHGVYSMAVTPFPDYHVWAADSEKNYIYKYSTHGDMLCSINLNDVVSKNNLGWLVDKQVSPASMVLDSDKNIWVTLYDTVSTLKFDSIGNFLFAVTPLSQTGYAIPPNINPIWFSDTQVNNSSPNESGDNNFIEPTGIDSDFDDNVWVTYSYFASGFLIKYSKLGALLNTISFPTCACPQEVVCDKYDNVWTLHSDLIWGDFGKVEKRNSNGTLLSSFGGIRQPNHATIDAQQNFWFTFDYDKVGKIDNQNSSFTVINLSSRDVYPYTPDYWFDKNKNTDDTVFNGICTDYRGFVYVINSIENQIYVLDQITSEYKDRFTINPQGMGYYIGESFGPTYTEYNPIGKSLQAQGDWSGFRWINKYGAEKLSYFNSTSSVKVAGESISLNYYNDNPYSVFKINEDFDMAGYMKSMAFIPTLNNGEFLFDNFLTSIFGKSDDLDGLGLNSYERIANFLYNKTDIDTCNVDSLYDLSGLVDINTDDFRLNYPSNIKRLIDLASINESILWGSLTDLELDIPKLIRNSDPINTTTYMVTAGDLMILKTKPLNQYRVLPTGPIYGDTVYSIQLLATSIGLDADYWRGSYEFFPAIDCWKNQSYTSNIIDWNNPNTNISPVLSSVGPKWLGDQGILETMLSYHLFKGLDYLS